MEAAWGTLDGAPPSSSSKKPTGKIPLPNSAASTSQETLEVTPLVIIRASCLLGTRPITNHCSNGHLGFSCRLGSERERSLKEHC